MEMMKLDYNPAYVLFYKIDINQFKILY